MSFVHLSLDHGRALHTHVLKFLEPPFDHFVQASLLNFYVKCGKINVCWYIFHQIEKPDLAIWNSILSAYATNSCDEKDVGLSIETLFLFTEMQSCPQIRPNEITLVALVSACADLGALSQGLWLHVYVLKNNLKLNHFVGTALIDMHSKCGCLDLAYQLFDELPQRDALCYNAMGLQFMVMGTGHLTFSVLLILLLFSSSIFTAMFATFDIHESSEEYLNKFCRKAVMSLLLGTSPGRNI